MTPDRIRAVVRRSEAQSNPDLLWNRFIDLMASISLEALTDVQKVAYYSFWYDAGLRTGGHLQFLGNMTQGWAEQGAMALERLGAGDQAEILREAMRRWLESPAGGMPLSTRMTPAEEMYAPTREGEFLDLDAAYHECEPTVTSLLEEYLREHRDEFIQFEEGG